MSSSRLYKYIEILIVGVLACLFLMRLVISQWNTGGNLPADADHWLYCYTFEHQITRLLGQNPGGIWDGGFYFPYNKISLLFHEPTWGISLAVLPIWLVTRDVFFIHNFGSVIALILSWICVYLFARSLGSSILYAFFAAMTFCLSGAGLTLIMGRCFFWPFFLIPCLGWLISKLFRSSNIIWGFLLGIGYGYLTWSSAHLAIMGGMFLFLFGLWHFWIYGLSKIQRRSIFCAFLSFVALSGTIIIPFCLIVFKKFFADTGWAMQQANFASNWINYLPWDRSWYFFKSFPFMGTIRNHAKGDTFIGISLILLFLAAYCVLSLLHSVNVRSAKKKLSLFFAIFYYSLPLVFSIINIFIFERLHLAKTAIFWTFTYYCFFGTIIVYFRNRILAALRYRAFFFFIVAVFIAFLTIGPYFVIGGNIIIPSPALIFSTFIPVFIGIRAISRWGIIVSFCLSLGVSLTLTQLKKNIARKTCIAIALVLCFFELFPGFYFYTLR